LVNYWKQVTQREREGSNWGRERPTCSFYSISVLAVSMPGNLSFFFSGIERRTDWEFEALVFGASREKEIES
jgi:hypothetical protein